MFYALVLLGLLAQTPPTTPSSLIEGGAGWLGAGLLAGVLSWLMWVHLPAKDRQLKELLEGKDKQIEVLLVHKWAAIEKMTDAHVSNVKTISAEFRTVIAESVRHCEAEIVQIMEWAERNRTIDRNSDTPAPPAAGYAKPPTTK